jgi:hypothetical protein
MYNSLSAAWDAKPSEFSIKNFKDYIQFIRDTDNRKEI